jgi:hypothetical protein
MIVWGGGFPEVNTGGRYRPDLDSWLATQTNGAPSARRSHTAVWTGSEMIVWGGSSPSLARLRTGARYSPAANSWVPTSLDAPPAARSGHSTTWTGTSMFVWGGVDSQGEFLNSGARYEAVTDEWAQLSSTGAPSPRRHHSATWTGTMLVVWGGETDEGVTRSGGRYLPGSDTWLGTTFSGAPAARGLHTAVWTGSHVLIWGGGSNDGRTYDPATDSWISLMSMVAAPSPREQYVAVWTGGELMVWGGLGEGGFLNDGARYSLASDSWSALPVPAFFPGRMGASGIWTGTEMIVWGGFDGVAHQSGARFDPGANVWTPTAIGAETASPRWQHSAVWNGSEMLVWGGQEADGTPLSSGGRYRPANEEWGTVSLLDAPGARLNHSAVSTGGTMLVWAGEPLASAGRDLFTYCFRSGCGRFPDLCAETDPCTATTCNAQSDACESAPVVCDDADPCTVDWCEAASGCVFDRSGADADADAFPDHCDNCDAHPNPSQSDLDGDDAGDSCDFDDGLILLRFHGATDLRWQPEAGFTHWNVYRGDLDVLRQTGQYTQAPGSNDVATRFCERLPAELLEDFTPEAGVVAYYLVTGGNGTFESSLGTDGAGQIRPNANPCP